MKTDAKKFNIKGIYLVLTEAACTYHSWEFILKCALKGGVKIIQLREKSVSAAYFYELSMKAKNIIDNFASEKTALIINDRVDIALACEADGVHLGDDDLPYEKARQIIGSEKIIGYSANILEDINFYNKCGCDYIGVSGIYKSFTKNIDDHIWGISGLEKARAITQKPLVAIGGINIDNAKNVKPFCSSIAVVSAICGAENPLEQIEFLVSLYNN